MTRPTVYLTNASSRTAPYRGPGAVWTIMAAPRRRYGECGDGVVPVLLPRLEALRDIQAGRITLGEYRAEYLVRLATVNAGGSLCATWPDGSHAVGAS